MVTINFYVGHNALATLTRHRCRFLAMCLSCPCDCKKLAYFPYSSTPPSSETVHSSTILEYWIPLYSISPNLVLALPQCCYAFWQKQCFQNIRTIRRPWYSTPYPRLRTSVLLVFIFSLTLPASFSKSRAVRSTFWFVERSSRCYQGSRGKMT